MVTDNILSFCRTSGPVTGTYFTNARMEELKQSSTITWPSSDYKSRAESGALTELCLQETAVQPLLPTALCVQHGCKDCSFTWINFLGRGGVGGNGNHMWQGTPGFYKGTEATPLKSDCAD